MEKIKVGVSSCLLGNSVRYNGQHQRSHFIKDELGKYCDFIPVCPEVECGLPIPRETLRLVGTLESQRLITTRTGIDYTDQMNDWAKGKLEDLKKEDLVGFIFKAKSPSSGMRDAKIYNEKGNPISYKGVGLFVQSFKKAFPRLPIEDDGRLHDPGLRDNFLEMIFSLQRFKGVTNPKGLIRFHSDHKYTLMAHSPELLKILGNLVSDLKNNDFDQILSEYKLVLVQALHRKKSRERNYNVLLHIFGYFKNELNGDEKQELLEAASNYYKGQDPLSIPITLLKHYTLKYNQAYLSEQTFFHPYPDEFGLLNKI